MRKSSADTKKKMLPIRVLGGWKDIATYLGKGVRTAQRYERELNLPVRRPAGKSTGSVIATTAELDAWVAAAPLRGIFHLSADSTAKTAVDTRAALDMLNREVAQLRRLREESVELRSDLHESVALLRKTIRLILIERAATERPDGEEVLSLPSKKIQ